MRSVLCAVWLVAASVTGSADDETIDERIRDADPGNGKSVFFQCLACHTVNEGEPHQVGPNLWNIIDSDIASSDSYSYSAALSTFPGKWSVERLDEFIRAPVEFVPGTKMVFPGLNENSHRADLLSWLIIQQENQGVSLGNREFDDNNNTADPFGSDWPEGAGRELTGYTCNVCHSLAIVKQQGLSQESWEEVIDWMIEEQGLRVLSEQEQTVIVKYLSTNFNIN